MFFKKADKKIFAPREKITTRENQSDKNKGRSLFSKTVFFIVAIFFTGVFGYVLSYAPFLRIEKINIIGAEKINRADVEERIWSAINEKYWKILPKNNLIIISQRRIQEDLMAFSKKIRSAEVKKIFPNQLEINISEHDSLMIFCKKEARNGSCYLLDERGDAYNEADFNSLEIKENNLVTIIDTSERSVALGDNVYKDDDIKSVLSLTGQFGLVEEIEFEPVYFTPARFSKEFRFITKGGVEILVSTLISVEDSVRTLKAFLKKEKEEKNREFEYIDLRIKNKIYYKVKEVPSEQKEEFKKDNSE